MFTSFDYETALLGLSEKLLGEQNYEEALLHLKELIRYFPASMEGRRMYGVVLYETGHLEESIASLKQTLQLAPQLESTAKTLAKYLIKEGRFVEAREIVESCLKYYPNTKMELHLFLAECLLNLDLLQEAHQLLDECAATSPENPVILELGVKIIYRLHASGQKDVAMQLISSLCATMVHNPCVAAAFLEITAMEKGIDEVLPHLNQFLCISKDPCEFTRRLVRILKKYGRDDLALHVAQASIRGKADDELRRVVVNLKQTTRGTAQNKKLVVFVEPMPRARTMKIAGALRKQGWETILIHNSEVHFDPSNFYNHMLRYTTQSDALAKAVEFNPRVYHVVSGHADENAVAFIKEKIGKIVFDPYDTVEGLIKQDYIRQIAQMQRFCIENADAICCRDLRPLHLKRALGYNLPKARIFFPDYCNVVRGPAPTLTSPSDEIHVAFAGSIVTSKHGHEPDWGILDVGKALANDKVHMHIYPSQSCVHSNTFKTLFSEYFEYSATNPYFHFHDCLPMDQLVEGLRKYHFAFLGTWDLIFGKSNPAYTRAAHRLCLSARLIDYIEAGLPSIIPSQLNTMHHLAARMGVGVTATPELFARPREALSQILRDQKLPGAMERAQHAYHIDRHIGRLIQFYEQF